MKRDVSFKDPRYGHHVHSIVYDRDTFREAWRTGQGQGQAAARSRDPHLCVVAPCTDEETALVAATLFCRRAFNIPSCTDWDGETISLYCADAGSAMEGTMRRAAEIVEFLGLTTYGNLFA